MGEPGFIIGGASKCGTSSVFRWLHRHPGVALAAGKELRYFGGVNAHKGWDWYTGHFPDDGRLGVEASPRYLTDADPAEVDARLPGVKLLFLLRDPVKRAYSDYWMHRALGLEDRPFEVVIEDPETRPRIVGTGEYASHLTRWQAAMGTDRVMTMLLDDVYADPQTAYQQLCRYIGIEVIDTPEVGAVVNARVAYRSLRARQAAKRLPRLGQRVVGRLNVKPLVYPPMSEATEALLRAHYAPHDADLADLLHRPLAWS